MTILFCGNNTFDFAGGGADVTDAAGRDSAYSATSILLALPLSSLTGLPIFRNIGSFTGDFWAHFRMHTPKDMSATGTSRRFMSIADEAGGLLIAIDGVASASTWRVNAYGDTTVAGAAFPMAADTTLLVDVKVTVNSTNIITEVYIGGVLASTATASNAMGLKGMPYRFTLDSKGTSTSGITAYRYLYLSEFIFASDESTVGLRLATLIPAATGTYFDWTGGVAEISDGNLATAAIASTSALKLSWLPSVYGGPSSPTAIRAVVSRTRASKGAGGPQRLKHFLRKSTVNYFGTTALVGAVGLDGTMEVWDNCPSTGVPWVTGNLTSMEVGIETVA